MQGYWKTYQKREINSGPTRHFKHRGKEYAKVVCFIFLTLLNLNSYSQNISEKKWNSDDFDSVFLKLEFVSNILIDKSPSNEIYIKYKREGELRENILLKTNGKNRELYMQEMASPILKKYNDKLSVHKTVASEIEVLVPINFKTIIKTKFSRINVLASFSNISLEIKEGHINLNQKNIKGEIKSISADVSCVSREVKLLVRSKNGLVSGLYNSYIEPDLKVETIRGNITTECLIN